MYVNIKTSFDFIGTERVNRVFTDRKTKNGEERAIFINNKLNK
jgi:hypothetical protein